MSTSGLEKATWTDADFSVMGWHDCRVHAVSVDERGGGVPPTRLLLDLDYIVRWVMPADDGGRFTHWISPATLVFADAWDVRGELGPIAGLLEIADLHRVDPPDGRPAPEWHIEGQNFDLRLRAPGFTQYLRRAPLHVPVQLLTPEERGGVSFAEQSFA